MIGRQAGHWACKQSCSSVKRIIILGDLALLEMGAGQWRLVLGKNIWEAWTLIIWEATTAKRNLL